MLVDNEKIIQNTTDDGYIISELVISDLGNCIIDYKPPYPRKELTVLPQNRKKW